MKKNKPSVSVVMATYNGARYLDKQLESIFLQTIQPNEIIISDDNSNDETISIINAHKKASNIKIRIFKNDKTLGYGKNFEIAIKKALGDYIFFSDQDDCWFPEKIETVLRISKENSEKFTFINDAVITDKNLVSSGVTKIEQYKNAGMSLAHFSQGCCFTIKKELKKIILPFPNFYDSHDNWINKLSNALNIATIIYKPLQYYRMHDENVSGYFLNTTKKTSKGEYYKNRLKKIINRKNNNFLTKDAKALKEIISRVKKIDIEEINNSYIKEKDVLVRRLNSINLRIKIKSQPFFKRFPFALKSLYNKDYKYYHNGFNSFFRDIFFKEKI